MTPLHAHIESLHLLHKDLGRDIFSPKNQMLDNEGQEKYKRELSITPVG
jgi:hypothetical protein